MAAFMSTHRPMMRSGAARKTSCRRDERRMKTSGRGRRHPAPTARTLVLPTIMRTRRRDATGVHPEGEPRFFPEGLLRKSAALRDFNSCLLTFPLRQIIWELQGPIAVAQLPKASAQALHIARLRAVAWRMSFPQSGPKRAEATSPRRSAAAWGMTTSRRPRRIVETST